MDLTQSTNRQVNPPESNQGDKSDKISTAEGAATTSGNKPTQSTQSEKRDVDFPSLLEMCYRDVQLADAKAAFAITMAALAIGGAASFFGSMPDPDSRTVALTRPATLVFLGFGGLFCVLGIVFATLVVLPRRYIREGSLEDGSNDGNDERARLDAWNTFKCNFLPSSDDGGAKWHKKMARHWKDYAQCEVDAMAKEAGRILAVRRRKYWWVGPAIICDIVGSLLMLVGVVIAIYLINTAPRDSLGKIILHTSDAPALNSPTISPGPESIGRR